jgi:probable HAF family extracellular repeat protein
MIYTVSELPTLYPNANSLNNPPYYGISWARAINDGGEIVGYSDTPQGNLHAVLWSGGSVTDLGTLDPDPNTPGQFRGDSIANAINNNGVIVGYSLHLISPPDNRSDARAFRWHKRRGRNGQMIELVPPAGALRAWANGINQQDEVTGAFYDGQTCQACVWDPAGKVTVLGIPPVGLGLGWNYSEGVAINDKSEVAVSTGDGWNAAYTAYIWSAGNWIPLRGPLPLGLYEPKAINNKSEMVGRDFRWDPLTGFHQLPPPFTIFDWAYATNDDRMIVGGIAGKNSQAPYAVVSWSGIFPADLNTLVQPNSGWQLWEARGINSSGSIVGVGRLQNRTAAFLATPLVSPQKPAINTVADVMKILAGVVADSGGQGLPFGGTQPIPIPPWGPESAYLPQPFRDASARRAFRQAASPISDANLRSRVKSVDRELPSGPSG